MEDSDDQNEPSAPQMRATLEYIRRHWQNPWMRHVIDETLVGNFEWRDE